VKEKEVTVLDKAGNTMSKCPKKRAHQMIRRGMADWAGWNVVQLRYDREDKKKFKLEALERDNYTCYICQKPMHPEHPDLSIDHIVSRAKGGSDLPENLACCCKQCNEEKANIDLEDFLKLKQAEKGEKHVKDSTRILCG
jgi:5-methylcytosine-specific restriction endonuclease McrA